MTTPSRPDGPDPTERGPGDRTSEEPTQAAAPDDGRGRRPGVHPSVERSGRSGRTAIVLAVALVAAIALYVAIASGISAPGVG